MELSYIFRQQHWVMKGSTRVHLSTCQHQKSLYTASRWGQFPDQATPGSTTATRCTTAKWELPLRPTALRLCILLYRTQLLSSLFSPPIVFPLPSQWLQGDPKQLCGLILKLFFCNVHLSRWPILSLYLTVFFSLLWGLVTPCKLLVNKADTLSHLNHLIWPAFLKFMSAV